MNWQIGTASCAEVFCTDAASSCARIRIPSASDNTPKPVTPDAGSSLAERRSSLMIHFAYRFIVEAGSG
jgi:hypothetical protein